VGVLISPDDRRSIRLTTDELTTRKVAP
jgi:hypothetical protein